MHKKNTYLEVQPSNTLEQDIYTCFCNEPRWLPPKYFYDDYGSQLFDQICETSEYYITRTEEKLLNERADEIVATAQPKHIIEFGSGVSRKTHILLDSCERQGYFCTYWPVDVCAEIIDSASKILKAKYPWLEIRPIIGDYHAGFEGLDFVAGRKLALFLGSTIGNMREAEAVNLLANMRQLLKEDDQLLLGADRDKDKDILEAAYNDSQGITAKFNLNLLQVLNSKLKANFIDKNFSHRATYNNDKQRMEIYLVSDVEQTIHFEQLDLTVTLQTGEHILTEVSRKFTLRSLRDLVRKSGYAMTNHFAAGNDYFSLLLMKADRGLERYDTIADISH